VELSQLLEVIGKIGTDEAPDDATLSESRTALSNALTEVLSGETPDVEAGEEIAAAIEDIDSELAARAEAREAQAAKAEELRARVGITAQTETPEADEDEEEESEPEAEAEGEHRSRSPEFLRTALTRAAVRAEANAEPEANSDIKAVGMGPAAGAVQNPNLSLEDAASIFHRFNRHVGSGSRQALLRLEKTYPIERQFGMSVEENTRMVEAVAGQRAIVAAGGICGPLEADFTHPVCGDRGRPIRDGLPAFNADRGGLRYAPAVTVGDLTDAVTVWTSENDASPGVLTKACPHIGCPDEIEAKVDAIVQCITVGNFQAKFNPEFWRSRLDLLMVEHDRIAEQTLFAQMQASAANVTVANTVGGTAKQALRALDRAAAGLRSRHRLNTTTQLDFIAPAWLRDALRSSITNSADDLDEYATADSILNGFFNAQNIDPIWSNDLQVFAAQGAGALTDFPATATTLLYPEGTFLFLDGGTLDLGIEITDSTLNATNDRQAFAETFEQAAFRGCEAIELILPVEDDCSCVGELGS
jgi:hypothetical protein